VQPSTLDWEEAEAESETEEQEEENNGADNSTRSGTPTRSGIHTEPYNHDHESPIPGRERRNRREPGLMVNYESGEGLSDEDILNAMMMVTENDLLSFEEANKSTKWRNTMIKEMESIEKNKTWELVDAPIGVKPIGVKWIFKTKLKENGEIDNFKARLVAKGYAQEYGVDYIEVFAPIARLDTICIIIIMAAHYNWKIFQLDVKSAFLHGELKEDIYVQQPVGFVKKGEKDKVYKLRKALYGLKQAPRAWYNKIENYFSREGFERCICEHTLFTKSKEGGKILIVSLYVDDLIYTGND